MLGRIALFVLVAFAFLHPQNADADFRNDNPDVVFADLYARLGINLPASVVRNQQLWLLLSDMKREPCDQRLIHELASQLDVQRRRREAAQSLYGFVMKCGEPVVALQRSVNLFMQLSDHARALEVADEYVRRVPSDHFGFYQRGMALEGLGDFKRALVDYSDTVELAGARKNLVSSTVFIRMANAYAKLGRYCEAMTPILTWVAFDSATRDTSQTQKIVADYQSQGNCPPSPETKKEKYALRGQKNVVSVKADINGVRGTFILDTGASYVTVKSKFAERAKISLSNATEVRLQTANGIAKGQLVSADKVMLGRLEAQSVPVVVQGGDDVFGAGIDGLLGMSFLARFDMQMAGGFVELSSRRRK